MAIDGTAFSALGAAAPLANRFQVGGCRGLAFKPHLTLRLKGAHPPRRPPEADRHRLLQGHRRSQHLARARSSCPAPPSSTRPTSARLHPGAVRRRSRQRRPVPRRARLRPRLGQDPAARLLPRSGQVFLRSSNHKLPDLVIALQGPAYQPIRSSSPAKPTRSRAPCETPSKRVPDPPFEQARLVLFGGKSAAWSSTAATSAPNNAPPRQRAHGRPERQGRPAAPTGRNSCKKHKRKRHAKHRHKGQ